MDSRKLQRVGGGTFTVSVPKEWAEGHGVDAGSEVRVYTHVDGSLVVRTDRREREALESARFELEAGPPAVLKRVLRAGYRAGFETVTVATAEPLSAAERREVTGAVRNRSGAEVATASDREITARCVLDPADVSVRQTLARLEFVVRSMHRSAVDALFDGGSADPFVGRDDEATRLAGLIARHCNRSLVDFDELDRLGVDRRRLFACHETARRLERVADSAVGTARVADYLADPPAEAARSARSVASAARDAVTDATDAVLDSGGTRAATAAIGTALDARDEARTVERALFERSPAGACPLAYALRECERTAECAVGVGQVALRSDRRGGDG